MPLDLASRVRMDQTRLELSALTEELRLWLKKRRTDDSVGQYHTQLNAIETLFDGAVDALRDELKKAGCENENADAVYESCRGLDVRILWLRRVWQFFREKFDQRDDPLARALLRAADEVVWSCYRPVFAWAEVNGLSVQQRPAPLPFLEARYSPEAFPSELVPQDLKTEIEATFLRDHLNRLPIPVVRLPPTCLRAPWMLVLLAHEIGHHVQYSLLENFQMVGLFRKCVQEAAQQAGASDQEMERWGRWAPEIFADVFSVLCMGQSAVRAMAELERHRPETMSLRRPMYPSPIVRLAILSRTADALGLDGSAALGGISPAALAVGNVDAEHDLQYVDSVVAMALDPLPGLPCDFRTLCGFDAAEFGPNGDMADWSRALNGEEEKETRNDVRAARLVAGGALAAWTQLIASSDDTQRAQRRTELAHRTSETIVACREEGTRGDDGYDALQQEAGRALAYSLLHADLEALVASGQGQE